MQTLARVHVLTVPDVPEGGSVSHESTEFAISAELLSFHSGQDENFRLPIDEDSADIDVDVTQHTSLTAAERKAALEFDDDSL